MRSAVLSRALAAASLVLTLALSFAVAACDKGQADEPEEVAATCSSVVAAICDAACECGGSIGCAIAGDSDDPEDWIAFDNKGDCLNVYSFGCSGESAIDYTACAQSLTANRADPQCNPTSGGEAFAFPSACRSPTQDLAGCSAPDRS